MAAFAFALIYALSQPNHLCPAFDTRWLRRGAWALLARNLPSRDGAGDLQDATVGTGGEGETLHRHAKHIHACFVGLGEEVNHALAHLGIAVDALVVLVSLGLYLSCLDDTLTNVGTRFAGGQPWRCP